MTRRFIAALLLIFASTLRAFDAQAGFAAGNRAYEQGKFAEAAAHYGQLVSNQVSTANVWFNLGNAEFKAGALGRAIAAYRRAEQLDPRDSALRANLAFVRRKVTGEEQNALPLAITMLRFLKPSEWTVLASAALAAFFVSLALAELRRVKLRGAIAASALGTLVLTAAAVFSHRDRFVMMQAAVVANQSPVRFGPLEESQTSFSLNQGAEVTVLDRTGDWFQIRDPARRTGWLKRDDVTIVTP